MKDLAIVGLPNHPEPVKQVPFVVTPKNGTTFIIWSANISQAIQDFDKQWGGLSEGFSIYPAVI